MVLKALENNKPELVRLFFQRLPKSSNKDLDLISQALLLAAIDKYPKQKDLASAVFEEMKNSPMKSAVDRSTRDGQIPICIAVQKKNPDLVSDLLGKFRPDVTQNDGQGTRP